MLVVTRYRVSVDEAPAFLAAAREAVAALGACPGFRAGRVGRAADDPTRYLIESSWVDVGSYRRALSAFDVRLRAIPLLSTAEDEPSAYEVLHERDATGTRDATGDLAADAATVRLGEAGGPDVPRFGT